MAGIKTSIYLDAETVYMLRLASRDGESMSATIKRTISSRYPLAARIKK